MLWVRVESVSLEAISITESKFIIVYLSNTETTLFGFAHA